MTSESHSLIDIGECPTFRGVSSRVRRSDRVRSEEHTSELQSHLNLVCRLLLEKKNTTPHNTSRGTKPSTQTLPTLQIAARPQHTLSKHVGLPAFDYESLTTAPQPIHTPRPALY